MEALKIEYDDWGRMKYNPVFHEKHGTPWTYEDLQYLITWYDFIGSEEMSFALDRPMTAIDQKVNALRKQGLMKRQAQRIRHEKINKGKRGGIKRKSCANSSN